MPLELELNSASKGIDIAETALSGAPECGGEVFTATACAISVTAFNVAGAIAVGVAKAVSMTKEERHPCFIRISSACFFRSSYFRMRG